jgi:hypothetical protein
MLRFYWEHLKNCVNSRKHYSFRHLARTMKKLHEVCIIINGLHLFPINCFTSVIEISYWRLKPQFINRIQRCKGMSLVICQQFHIWLSVMLLCNTGTTQPPSQIFMKYPSWKWVMLIFRPCIVEDFIYLYFNFQ